MGGWSGPDGVVHQIAYHNLVNDWGWFPLFSVVAGSSQNSVVTLIGNESRNGQSVIHISVAQQFHSLPPDSASLMAHLSQVDIFLDAATLLPAAITYAIHPDDNALQDIPVELQFSSYGSISGVQVPHEIRKFINNSLALDLQFKTATFNTGLSATQIGAL